MLVGPLKSAFSMWPKLCFGRLNILVLGRDFLEFLMSGPAAPSSVVIDHRLLLRSSSPGTSFISLSPVLSVRLRTLYLMLSLLLRSESFFRLRIWKPA